MFQYPYLKPLSGRGSFFLVGVVFFVYSLCAGAAIQLYIVPEVFPHFNLGDGLAVLDSNHFSLIAKDKSAEIIEKGWGAWELRPRLHAPAGMASMFYVLWVPKPYSMLPFNALIHAISGCLVLWVLRQHFPWQPAILGSSLFVLNPTAMEWVSQIHRDGVFILGNLMVMVCLLQMEKGLRLSKVGELTWGFVCGLMGTSFVWVARPHWVQVLSVSVFLCACLIGFYCWAAGGERSEA